MKSKFLTLLLSVAIALGLWVYVVTNVSPEHEQKFYGIPVILENEKSLLDKKLMLVSGDEYTVSFVLKGNRAELNKLSSNELKVTVDLSEVDGVGQHRCEYKVSFPSGVSGVTLERRITDTVVLEVAEYAEKEVPVQVILNGEQPEGVFVDREGVTTSVTTVKVSGAKEEVDQIDIAGIEVDATKLTETVSGEFVYTLMNKNGEPVETDNVTTDTGKIHMLLPVEYFKVIPVSVELVEGGGAKKVNAKVEMDTESLTISGSQEALKNIDSVVLTTVDLANVDLEKGYETDVPLNLPDNLTNHSGLESVHVKVTLQGLMSKTLAITREQIKNLNLPEGMQATISNVKLDVQFRGPSALVKELTAEHVNASIDLKDQLPGTYTLPVNLEVQGIADVGAWGKYSVTVTLAPAQNNEDTQAVD